MISTFFDMTNIETRKYMITNIKGQHSMVRRNYPLNNAYFQWIPPGWMTTKGGMMMERFRCVDHGNISDQPNHPSP